MYIIFAFCALSLSTGEYRESAQGQQPGSQGERQDGDLDRKALEAPPSLRCPGAVSAGLHSSCPRVCLSHVWRRLLSVQYSWLRFQITQTGVHGRNVFQGTVISQPPLTNPKRSETTRTAFQPLTPARLPDFTAALITWGHAPCHWSRETNP